MRRTQPSLAAWLAAATCLAPVALPALAQAQTATPAAPAATPPAAATPAAAPAAADAPPPGYWIDGIHLSAQIDAGFNLNPLRPNNGLNFGQLFTDHANQAQLNQLLLTANKPLDPKDPGLQWGFKVQFMYGSDARYTQFLGELNNVNPGDRYQLDVVEANVLAHLPYLTEGGIDLKLGQYSTPLGYETIDPSTNPFYTHSYIFQFGLPFKHTGGLATVHVNDTLDLYAGVDTGTNTTFGPLGDENGAAGGIAGFGLNGLMGGNLTVLALSHFGPEQASRVLSPIGINANGQWRYYNDVILTYKASDALTLVTEFNWVRDDYGVGKGAVNAFGAAQYASYTLTDTLTLNGRAELWRDDNNFFVASFSGNNDPVRFQQGLTPVSGIFVAPGGSTTYGSLTAGVTYKPDVPAPITGLLLRPEIRWDHAMTSNKPFNQGNGNGTNDAFTLSADAVLTF
ncbi:MAG: outer membrane beta-barrel protein [Acetobacteraceae bacterium]|nr:outer membrane beta-barrel protein [Acetobacteraceae bacterium]